MNLWNLWIQYIEYLCDLFNEKKFWKLILHILLILFCLFSFAMVVSGILYLVSANWEAITTAVGCIVIVALFLIGLFPKKEAVSALPESTQASYDPVFLNSTYNLLRTNMVSVLAEVADMLHLRIPSTPSQIEAPVHYDIVNNAAIFHFLCGKQESSVKIDPFEAIGIIQNVLERRLNGHELMGINQTTTFYNGMAYPAIMVDNVQDLGRYIQIDIAITNDNYLRYRTNRLYCNVNDSNTSNPYDRNF